MFQPSMNSEMDALEARKAELTALLADIPEDVPDLLPSASAKRCHFRIQPGIYRQPEPIGPANPSADQAFTRKDDRMRNRRAFPPARFG